MAKQKSASRRRQLLALSDSITFFGTWLKAPRRTGAVVPSSRQLARAMAAEVDPAARGVVVELGGGTGQFTRALLDRGVAPDRLIVIERDAALVRLLQHRFPGITVLCADAGQLARHLRFLRAGAVAAIVSGLPFLSLPPTKRKAILAQCAAVLPPGKPFIQFTYGPGKPFKPEPWGFTARPARWILRYVPPATVCRFEKLRGAASAITAGSEPDETWLRQQSTSG